jgi:hypothetical protein
MGGGICNHTNQALLASWGATENAADFNYVSPTLGQLC